MTADGFVANSVNIQPAMLKVSMFTFSDCRLRLRRAEIDCANFARADSGRSDAGGDGRFTFAAGGYGDVGRRRDESRRGTPRACATGDKMGGGVKLVTLDISADSGNQ